MHQYLPHGILYQGRIETYFIEFTVDSHTRIIHSTKVQSKALSGTAFPICIHGCSCITSTPENWKFSKERVHTSGTLDTSLEATSKAINYQTEDCSFMIDSERDKVDWLLPSGEVQWNMVLVSVLVSCR